MAGPQYSGSIPQIAQAYQNDPRNRIANTLMQSGMNTAPVAQGGWGIADGLARAAQALGGAFMQRNTDRKFADREGAYVKGMQTAAGLEPGQDKSWMAPNPAMANPGTNAMANAASALNGTPPQAQPPVPPMLSGQGVPARIPSFDPGQSSAQQAPPVASLAPPQRQAPPVAAAQGPSARDYYYNGIVPIEGGTGPNGEFRTSPKGAVGPGQVMPGTAPEAARLAGLPWDENKYRTDANYNNALGEAYYGAQLERFGDPVLAAAAYNAGPGRVSRALRRAEGGGNWQQFIPPETRQYVQNFSARVAEGGQAGAAPGAPPVPSPTMEVVPQAPQAPVERPQAPGLPAPVQNQRMQVARRMLQSGNPDLMQIAQTYLDKGLDDQSAYDIQRNSQEFQQSQTGYGADLQNYTGAQSDARQFGYNQVSAAQDRNFSRETNYNDQTFQRQERIGSQGFQSGEARADREFQSQQNALDRANALEQVSARSTAGGGRNPFLDTAQGVKLQQDMQAQVNTNAEIMTNVQRFLELNRQQATGGWVLGSELGRSIAGMTDQQISEMNGIANQITIGKLGGLGVAISDGDRKFVADSMLSGGSPQVANANRGNAILGVLQRQNDYAYQWQLAQMEDRATTFHQDWKKYIDSTPVVRGGPNGTVLANPVTYEEWRRTRPQYDASGKRIN